MRTAGKRKAVAVWVCALAVILLAGAAQAKGPKYDVSWPSRVTNKFFRGATNVALGIVEVPLAINEETQMLDPFTGTLTGLVKGLGRTGKRVGVGLYEVVTFPIPAPPRYRPIIEPILPMWNEL